ncbi:MAG: HAMP domain-containing histidine kinase [Bacteroidota bacterium]|nr:MAG: HAMP domain-containing histidine kinase [Bacteroidota bacterium]
MDTLHNMLIELESKILILERENEVLSEKAEENLLLNRAFTEINSNNNPESMLTDALESISILLDIQFSGIFDYVDNRFICKGYYTLFLNEDNVVVDLQVCTDNIEKFLSNKEKYFLSNELSLQFNPSGKGLSACCYAIIKGDSVIDSNRFYVFANDTTSLDLKPRLPLLERVIQILTARRERLYYQSELERVNSKLQAKNLQLEASNEMLLEKQNTIVKQNEELKATMENLKLAQAHLVQAEKMASLGVLTAGVAHEINNPLNYILGGYHGITDHFETIGLDKNERLIKMLDIIKIGVDRVSNIVKSLNQFSRNNQTNDEVCDLHAIVENCLTMLNNQLKNRIGIQKNYWPGQLDILGNNGKLHQVFLNILSNAVQSIENTGEINIKTLKKGGEAIISIQDTGCGISQENLTRITDPFFTTKDPNKGIGLGLSICYGIIKEHKGKMEFNSELHKGTTVNITLPLNDK